MMRTVSRCQWSGELQGSRHDQQRAVLDREVKLTHTLTILTPSPSALLASGILRHGTASSEKVHSLSICI